MMNFSYEQAQMDAMKDMTPPVTKPQPKDVTTEVYKDSTEFSTDIGGSSDSSDATNTTNQTSDESEQGSPKQDTKEVADKSEQTAPKTAPVSQPKASTEKPRVQPKPTVRASKLRGDCSQIPRFPNSLMRLAVKEFPDAANKSEALAAYVYVKSGMQADVPENVKQLASTYQGDMTGINIENRLHRLETNLQGMMIALQELELGLSYLVFDRKGFSKDNPKDAKSIDYLEPGVVDARNRLRDMTIMQRKEDLRKEGRPKR